MSNNFNFYRAQGVCLTSCLEAWRNWPATALQWIMHGLGQFGIIIHSDEILLEWLWYTLIGLSDYAHFQNQLINVKICKKP